MNIDPNEQTSTSFWRKFWTLLAGENKEAVQPISLWSKPGTKPKIHLSSEQHDELKQAMDLPSPNDTNFLPSDTSFRTRKASSAGEKSVII